MLIDDIKKERIIAMKARDSATSSLLSTLLGEVENATKSGNHSGGIADDIVVSTVKKFIKNNNATISALKNAGKDTASLEAEIEVLSKYMPKILSEAQTENIIAAQIIAMDIKSMKDMGKLMGYMKKNFAATVDMGLVSRLVKQHLGE